MREFNGSQNIQQANAESRCDMRSSRMLLLCHQFMQETFPIFLVDLRRYFHKQMEAVKMFKVDFIFQLDLFRLITLIRDLKY